MNWKSLYKSALRALIGAVTISALLGIYALLTRDLDPWSARLLGTTLFVSAGALLVMTSVAVIESRPRPYFYMSLIGVATAVAALPVLLAAVWMDGPPVELWKSGVTIEIASIVAGHSSLLSIRRLPQNYRMALPLTTALAASLGASIAGLIWAEASGSPYWRTAGTLSILVTAATIIVPIIPRLAAVSAPVEPSAYLEPDTGAYEVNHCPRCGVSVHARQHTVALCGGCGARFSVEFEQPAS